MFSIRDDAAYAPISSGTADVNLLSDSKQLASALYTTPVVDSATNVIP